MSIILEALRKAEAGRREQDRLGLIGTPLARDSLRTRIPLWIPAAGIAALLGAGVAFYALRPARPAPAAAVERQAQTQAMPAPSAPSVAAAAPASAALAPESAAEDDAPQPQADVRPLAREVASTPSATATEAKPQRGSIEVEDLSGADASAAPASPGRAAKIKPGSVQVQDLLVEQGAPPVPPEAAAPLPDPSTGSERAAPVKTTPPAAPAVPSVDDLVAGGQLQPPNLSLDMHTYSNDPAACFVYINMRLYHNGDTTREGAIVEEITADGVVMRMHGLRFLLQSR
jgi:hypothetical protein